MDRVAQVGRGDRSASMDVVTLPMYELPEVAEATTALLQALSSELTRAGWPVQQSARRLGDHRDHIAHWLDPTTALSQSCGLPYLEDLDGRVAIVGTLQWRGVVDDRGYYRSKVVVAADHHARTLADLRGARPAVNNPQSLSGWCSLGAALATVTDDPSFVAPFVVTGSHVESLERLRSGLADVTAVDRATYRLLERHRPDALAGTRVLIDGPLIPATPLITRIETPIGLQEVRACVRRALDRPALADALALLGIDGLVPMHRADYRPVITLVEHAERVLPRSTRQIGKPT